MEMLYRLGCDSVVKALVAFNIAGDAENLPKRTS
jgi:hypothetical protein